MPKAKRRRRRGEGSVYASQGSWIAALPLGVRDGKRVTKRARCRTEDDANDELDRLRRAYGSGADLSRRTLDDYLRIWLAGHRRVQPSTLLSYTGHVKNHISPLLGGIVVGRLRPRDVDRLIDDRTRAGLAPATVGRIVTTLRIALASGVKRGELVDNPAARVDLPRVPRQTVRPMTDAEAQRLVDVFAKHWLGPLVRLLSGSGLRLGEALSLNQGDAEPGFVRIRESKTTLRAVPISRDATAAIKAAKAVARRTGRDEPLFFGPRRNRKGQYDRLRGWSVSHAVPKVIVAAGLDRLTPHGFRHGAATLMVAKGAHMRIVAAQLGHKNPGLTARVYAHVLPESQREAANLLNRRVSKR